MIIRCAWCAHTWGFGKPLALANSQNPLAFKSNIPALVQSVATRGAHASLVAPYAMTHDEDFCFLAASMMASLQDLYMSAMGGNASGADE